MWCSFVLENVTPCIQQAKIFHNLRQEVLAHQNVYAPLKHLMQVCTTYSAKRTGPQYLKYQESLIELLQLVCGKVQKQPFFADLFLEVSSPGKRATHSSSGRPSAGGGGDGGGGGKGSSEFILLSAAMSLLDVEDTKVQRKVRACMKICLCLPSSSVAATVTEGGAACTEIARRLLQLYAEMPQEFEPYDDPLQDYVGGWTIQREPNWHGLQEKHAALPLESKQFLQFMDWLFFCDFVAGKAELVVAQSIAANVVNKLVVMVRPMLSKQAENVAIAAMTYMTACVTQIKAPPLVSAFVSFLVGGGNMSSSNDDGGGGGGSLAPMLIDRCNHMSDEVSLSSLRLLHQLLLKRDEQVLHGLVLQYMEEVEAPLPGEKADVDSSVSTTPTPIPTSAPSHAPAPTPAPDAVQELRLVASTLLSQVPENLRSADDEDSYR